MWRGRPCRLLPQLPISRAGFLTEDWHSRVQLPYFPNDESHFPVELLHFRTINSDEVRKAKIS
ncbi:unnamed protein product, partial [Nesidiocoris tenuis]